MAEPARTPSIIESSNNISDVLASIRRLIAQDEANRQPEPMSDYPLDLRDEPVAAEVGAIMKMAQDSDLVALQRQLAPPLILRSPEVRFDEATIAPPAANLANPVEDLTPRPEDIPRPKIDADADAAPVGDLSQAQAAPAIASEAQFQPSEEPSPHLFAIGNEEPATEKLIRAVVRETVLQELQGELGGRVSRNIRDLVRAEIDRALNGQKPPI